MCDPTTRINLCRGPGLSGGVWLYCCSSCCRDTGLDAKSSLNACERSDMKEEGQQKRKVGSCVVCCCCLESRAAAAPLTGAVKLSNACIGGQLQHVQTIAAAVACSRSAGWTPKLSRPLLPRTPTPTTRRSTRLPAAARLVCCVRQACKACRSLLVVDQQPGRGTRLQVAITKLGRQLPQTPATPPPIPQTYLQPLLWNVV